MYEKPISARQKLKQINYNTIREKSKHLFFKTRDTGVSMDEIAKVIGFTKRTIYKYFQSKDSLFESVLSLSLEQFREYIVSENNDNIKEFLQNIYNYGLTNPENFYFIKKISFEIDSTEKQVDFLNTFAVLVKMLETKYSLNSTSLAVPVSIWNTIVKAVDSKIPLNVIEDLILHGIA